MNRIEFMDSLTRLLGDLPESEREEALHYYNDYLDDAGVENEQEVLEALGTPKQLAESIREGLNEDSAARSEFSEKGFRQPGQNTRDRQVAKRKAGRNRSGMSTGALILIIICCICAAPILLPVAFVLLLVLLILAIVAVVVAVVLLFSGVICIAAGLYALVAAIVKLFVVPAGAMVAVGISMMVIGIGILLVLGMAWLIGRIFPKAFRGFADFCGRLFRRKGGKGV